MFSFIPCHDCGLRMLEHRAYADPDGFIRCEQHHHMSAIGEMDEALRQVQEYFAGRIYGADKLMEVVKKARKWAEEG